MKRKKVLRRGGEAAAHEVQARFEMDDLALGLVPISARGRASQEEAVRELAATFGVGYEALAEYRVLAALWPAGTRVAGVSWADYSRLSSRGDRFALIGPRP